MNLNYLFNKINNDILLNVIFWISVVSLINNNLYSQNIICGKIISKIDEHPINDVNIYFSNISFGCFSNIEGEFKIDSSILSPKDTFFFSRLGYKERKISVENFMKKQNKTIILDEHITELKEVIIGALSSKKIIEKSLNRYNEIKNSLPKVHFGYIKQVSYIDSILVKFASSDIKLQNRRKVKLINQGNQFKKEISNPLKGHQIFFVKDVINLINVKKSLIFCISNFKKFNIKTIEKKHIGSEEVFQINLKKQRKDNQKTEITLIIDSKTYDLLSIMLYSDRNKGESVIHKNIQIKPISNTIKISYINKSKIYTLKSVEIKLINDIKKDSQKDFKNTNLIKITFNDINKKGHNLSNFNLKKDIFSQIIRGNTFPNQLLPLNIKERKFIYD